MLKSQQLLQERYQLREQLSNNPTRQTWLATDIQSEQNVIVKLLPFSPQTQWQDIKLFEREAQILQHLDRDRIPHYLDYFSVTQELGGGLPWFALVQEYIPGSSLQQLLKTGKIFTEAEAKAIATQLLEILIDLHELSPPVLHRDLKPSNIIQGEDGKIYLVDFGAVQDKAKAEGVTFTVVGTGGYAPPEQLWGRAVAASDLYGLGATLVHLLTGIAPGELPQRRMRLQFRDKASLSPEFAGWLDKLLDPAVEKRFNQARQALTALQAAEQPETPLKVRYGRLGGLALLQYGAVGLCALVLPLFAAYRYIREGKIHVGAMNRAQQAHFLEENEFTDSIERVQLGIKPQTENYSYSIRQTPLYVLNLATPRKDGRKAYMGIVALVGTRDTDAIFTATLTCEAKEPRTTLILPSGGFSEPKIENGAIHCPSGMKELGELQEGIPIEGEDWKRAYSVLEGTAFWSALDLTIALQQIGEITDGSIRARVLETIAPHLDTSQQFDRALELAETVENSEAKARVLLAIAPQLDWTTSQRERAMQIGSQAFALLAPSAATNDDFYKSWVVAKSLPYLTTPAQIEQAVEIAQSIQSDKSKIDTIRAIAPQLKTEQQADGVLQIIPSFKESQRESAGYKAAALKEIAPHLRNPQQFDTVLQMTQTIKEDKRQAAVLMAIAPNLKTPKQITEALKIARSFHPKREWDKANVITAIAPQLKTEQQYDEARALAETMQNETTKSQAIQVIKQAEIAR